MPLVLPPNLFRTQFPSILDPQRPQKSSIFIENVVNFEGFEILKSGALMDLFWWPLGLSFEPSWVPLGAFSVAFGVPE